MSEDVQALLAEAREADDSVSVCGVVREDADEELIRRRDAVDELREALEELAGGDGRRPEYVRYEGEWHRIELSSWAI